ncbi:glutamine--tRNA ligase [secondary endosymbiont of Ctenarytaina eucalypti]|uniref:Glutamine--tRNA ligase n=1 Tax=secondary endosymbiont of Ctenarytaina eucalypti TaxID=1199245 RepID=J3VSR6_9ENTR|nr:glutamine--tRNA ligase [secondary endosymbiont of Ctenarytaina eucalypti]AFP84991.1 glutaminyl-tRNA synthetase [secondary endosymbiont of Ctenarytaina eucalypti]
MSKAEPRSTNFIRHIIEKDLASGKHRSVHTRFSPEPNGYLHIGHAKSIFLNFGIAQDYQGQCNLRFDDTNPVKENIEYIESIKRDLQWLGCNWSGDIHYSSDYFDTLYEYALELIGKGLAYVDQLSPDEIREHRGTLTRPGQNSPYRDRSVEENRVLFAKMRNGEFAESCACLRAKIDMTSPFMVMRDPVLYRIRFAYHHQTGDTWCIYPMYDFTHCISDALEGITHSLCTLEFQENRQLYNWILDHITIDGHPQQYEFSRLNLEYAIMSKRKLNLLVTEKIVEGWDDPRMPTIAGLRRRGYTANSIYEFCQRIGVTKQDSNVEMAALEACIREDLNERAPRAMAVIDPVRIVIESLPAGHEQDILMRNHIKNPDMGTRLVAFSRDIFIDRSDFCEEAKEQYKRLVLGKEVRLRNSYVIKAERVRKDTHGTITTIFCRHDPDTLNKDPSNKRKVKGVIHWVSATRSIFAEFRLYNRLFIAVNPSIESNVFSMLNPDSLIIRRGFVEAGLESAKAGEPFQFEREGYFCADSRYFTPAYPVFNRIVGLRDTFLAKVRM